MPTPIPLPVRVRMLAPADHLGKARARRAKEVEAWTAARAERTIMTTFVYCGISVAIGVLTYVCLLFGVKFAPQQAEAWVVGTLIGFVTDILVQEPLVELLKVVVSLLLMLCRSSLRGTVMNRIAAKRDAIKLALGVAQEFVTKREGSGGSGSGELRGSGTSGEGAGASGTTPIAAASSKRTSPPAVAGGGVGGAPSGPKAEGDARGADRVLAERPVGVVDMLMLWPGRRSAARV